MKTPTSPLTLSLLFLLLSIAIAQPSNHPETHLKRNQNTDPSTESVIVTAPDEPAEDDPLASLSVNPTVVQTGAPLPSSGDADPSHPIPSTILTAPGVAHHHGPMTQSSSSLVVVPAETATATESLAPAYASASASASLKASASASATPSTAAAAAGGSLSGSGPGVGQWAVLVSLVGVWLC